MARLSEGAWVLVADGEKALFLENVTDGADPHLKVVKKEEQDNPPTREQAANRPGKVQDSTSHHQSSYDDTDWHKIAKERFAVEVAEMLYRRAHRGEFEKLVVVASPQVLGDLRSALHSEVSNRIVAEIPKTLTNHSLRDIEKLVKADLAEA